MLGLDLIFCSRIPTRNDYCCACSHIRCLSHPVSRAHVDALFFISFGRYTYLFSLGLARSLQCIYRTHSLPLIIAFPSTIQVSRLTSTLILVSVFPSASTPALAVLRYAPPGPGHTPYTRTPYIYSAAIIVLYQNTYMAPSPPLLLFPHWFCYGGEDDVLDFETSFPYYFGVLVSFGVVGRIVGNANLLNAFSRVLSCWVFFALGRGKWEVGVESCWGEMDGGWGDHVHCCLVLCWLLCGVKGRFGRGCV